MKNQPLYFLQQSPNSNVYFQKKYNRSYAISLEEMPHYLFLKEHLTNPYYANNPYFDYIAHSWNTNDKRTIKKQVDKFLKLYYSIADGDRKIQESIKILKHNNIKFIVDGNHRAAISLALGIYLPEIEITLDEWLQNNLPKNSKFAISSEGIPYQSFDIDSEKYYGRRSNPESIHQLIQSADIENKTILDLGCNIGTHTYIAKKRGAKIAIGVEKYQDMLLFATRINNFNKLNSVYFVEHDLNQIYQHNAHTVFCFSVDAHIDNKNNLLETLKMAKNCIYLETHSNKTIQDYEWLLKEFKNYELLGNTDDGIHTTSNSRLFIRIDAKK